MMPEPEGPARIYTGCKHIRKTGRKRYAPLWQQLRVPEFEAKNIFIFVCGGCQAIKQKILILTDGKYGPEVEVKTKLLKSNYQNGGKNNDESVWDPGAESGPTDAIVEEGRDAQTATGVDQGITRPGDPGGG